MIRVAIYGNNKVAQIAQHVIERLYNQLLQQAGGEQLEIITFVQNVEEGVVEEEHTCQINEAILQYKHKHFDAFLIPLENYVGNHSFVHAMIQGGVDINDIYLCSRMNGEGLDHMDTFLTPYLSKPYLPYLEYHVADQCNLNCRACEHYSGLVMEPKFPVFEEWKEQIQKLKSYISDIGMIRILGGEPLLNPELGKYIRKTKELYPEAIIGVVTNALLIKQMPESLWKTMKETDTVILISFYPPMKEKMPEIEKYIQEKGITCSVSDYITCFTKKQVLTPQPDRETEQVFFNCVQARCHNLYEGKLAACFLPFTTRYFNSYYKEMLKEPLPEDGAIDLYQEGLTVEEMKLRLLVPFERCRYCSEPKEINWGQITHPSPLEDWIKMEN